MPLSTRYRVSVSLHAIERYRERSGACHMPNTEVRRMITAAVLAIIKTQWVSGQLVQIQDTPACYAVIQRDKAGRVDVVVVSVFGAEEAAGQIIRENESRVRTSLAPKLAGMLRRMCQRCNLPPDVDTE
jgi:hypothetical protein